MHTETVYVKIPDYGDGAGSTITMYAYHNKEYKFLFFIDVDSTIRVFDGIDTWCKGAISCPEHVISFDKKTKKIDWIGYRFHVLNYPDPFDSDFKKYAQKILNLQVFS